MRTETRKVSIWGKRVLAVMMAAASLCSIGCGKPVSEELPDAEHSIFGYAELPDTGYTKTEYEKYIPIGLHEIATPEPVVSYPGVNISYAHEVTAFATDDSIYMRARPDSSTEDDNIVKKVQDAWAVKFSILGKTDDWYYARYTEDGVDYVGFVRKDDFYIGEAAPTPTPEPTNKPKKTPEPEKEEKEDKDDKDDKKNEPTPTPKPKGVGKTPYSNKYEKVKLKFESSSEGITFQTTTLDGEAVSDSLFSRNGITMINIWTQT